jgi:signal transduction histidine kinase/ligand-binding sensor domain-containing protein/DNA-binding response OmpR family regulator
MMRKGLQLFLTATLLFLITGNVFAQTQPRNFRTISVDKGLSQSTVYAVMQDTLGFMWMATQDGLNRYDGERFTVYHPVDKDPNSLVSNYIKAIYLDHNGQLWIGGDQGLSRYNYSTNKFVNYQHARKPGEWYISAITEDVNHIIWAGTSAGEIFRLDPSNGALKLFNIDGAANAINSITSLSYFQKTLLIGTDAGLFKLTNGGNRLKKLELGVTSPSINEVFIDGSLLWIGTEGNGLFCYDTHNSAVQHYVHLSGQDESLTDNDVRGINKDGQGHIWAGTFRGLSILDPHNGKFENYYHQATIPYTISQNSVRCVYRDRQQGMWLGTFYGGVDYYHKNDIKFNLLNQNTGRLSLNDEVINVIKQDDRGSFWIGTNDKGLNHWDSKTNVITYYSYKESGNNGLSSNNIKSIAFEGKDKVFLGTHNAGLDILDQSSGQVKVFRHNDKDSKSLSGDMVYALLKDKKARIWVGTRSGLDLYDPANQSFDHVYFDAAGKRLSSDEIAYLMEDSKGRIWIGTTNGVNQFYPDNRLFEVFPGSMLSNEVVNCITEDQKHRIWIGTRDGLNLYDEDNHSFITYKNRSEFLRGTIYGIVAADDGNLWISTNNGLVCFNPDTRRSQWFDSRDGLQSNQFNLYAFCKASDGMLLFGGINGISYFYPAAVRQQALALKVTFTGLEVLNKAVTPDDGTDILTKHIDKTAKLEFKHDQRQFTIFFNTFNYISANRTRFLYKLNGVDAVWQQTEHLSKASYSNLLPGNYLFEVKAIGPNGESSPIRNINIEILPPWYGSTWFYLLIIIALGVGSYVAYRVVSERIRTLQQLKTERMERDKVNYINQVKTDFFTNVSHELRTPLTLILAPLEEIMSKPVADKQLSKQYKTMLTNARRLYQLVDQLFEFRKAESGTRKLQVDKGEIVSFIHEIYSSFQPLSDRNHIKYNYITTEAKLSFLFDKDAVEKILFNLLSNAFKYTPAEGQIRIELSKSEKDAIIKITDTGKGIKEEHLEKIFDRFYQVNDQEMNLGSGVGLAFTHRLVELHHGTITVESSLGIGSVFTVTLPLDDERYREEVRSRLSIYDLSSKSDKNESLTEGLAKIEDDLSTADNPADELQHPTDMLERERLLIVDDNDEIVSYLSDRFSQFYEICTAYDGEQALNVLDGQQIDLIICDVMMPELDGLHFCKRVKQNIQTCHIPVLLLTAKADTQQQIKGLEMGADDYVTKPFSMSLLEAKVQNILRSRKRLKEFYSSSKEIVPENIAFNTLDEDFLRRAIALIESHLSESDFSVDKFSREIGMSRSNLYLKLRAITGESVTDFIKRIRFKKAVELMEQRQYTIAQVAYMSGFNSPSYFSTAFKQYYDCMPTEYLAKKDLEKN